MTKLFDFDQYSTSIDFDYETSQIPLPVKYTQVDNVLSYKNLNSHYDVLHTNYIEKSQDGNDSDYVKGGILLHNLFFEQLQQEDVRNYPTGPVKELISNAFNGYMMFKKEFERIATSVQGSGWCYLSTNGIIKTIKDHSVVDDVVFIVDMWEHSYYTDYGPDKSAYINNLWKITNWEIVNSRL